MTFSRTGSNGLDSSPERRGAAPVVTQADQGCDFDFMTLEH